MQRLTSTPAGHSHTVHDRANAQKMAPRIYQFKHAEMLVLMNGYTLKKEA